MKSQLSRAVPVLLLLGGLLSACGSQTPVSSLTDHGGLQIQIDASIGASAVKTLGLNAQATPDKVSYASFNDQVVPFITNQLIVHADSQQAFRSWVRKYGATVLDDGTIDPSMAPASSPVPSVVNGLAPVRNLVSQNLTPAKKSAAVPFNTGYRLVEVTLPDVKVDDLNRRMVKKQLKGQLKVTNQQALNLLAAQNGAFDQPGVTVEVNRLGQQQSTLYTNGGEQRNVLHSKSVEYTSTRINQVWPLSLGEGVKVGIIDTGFRGSDYDISGYNLYAAQFPTPGTINYGRSVLLYDMCLPTIYTSCDNPWTSPGAANYHGEMVLDVLWGAQGNGIGGAGIAPRSNLTLFNLGRFSGAVSYYDAQRAVSLASSLGIKVLNMSFDYPTLGAADVTGSSLHAAIINATNNGMIVVAAAGNQGQRIENGLPYTTTQGYAPVPAAWPEVIAVGGAKFAVTQDAQGNQVSVTISRETYSNYGPMVNFFAPTQMAISHRPDLCPTYTLNQCVFDTTKFSYSDGTSSASPYLAGVIALMVSKNPTLNAQQVRGYLMLNRRFTGDLTIDPTGGFIDAKAAYDAVPAW